MKKLIIIFAICSNNILYSQTAEIELLNVISVCEFENSYLISCLNKDLDTLYIISEKESIKNKYNYDKIKIGEKYSFRLQNRGVPILDNFMVRIRDKVFWKTGDNPSEMPFFAENVKDLYIIK